MTTLVDIDKLVLDPPELGYILHLSGLPGAGSKIYDRSPYGNHGSITGATWIRTPGGLWCLSFDGSDDYFTVGNTSTFKFLHGALDTTGFVWTISWWMALDTPEPNSLYGLFSSCRGASTAVGVNIYYRDDGANTRRLDLMISTGAGAGTTVVTDYSDDAAYPNDTNWHFCCITWDQSLANTNGIFYIDGTSKGTINKTANVPSTANANDALYFGILSDGINFDLLGNAILHRIYNRALSAFQIQNHFNQEKHLFGV